jgi:hypothetical protein
MSRCFARVGVEIPAARLQEIAAGAAASSGELTDVQFALMAIELQREERLARSRRRKRRGIHCLIVAGTIVAAMNLLACTAFVFVCVLLHESPF